VVEDVSLQAKMLLVILTLAFVIVPILSVKAFVSAAEATVFVYPEKVTAKVNQTFQVFVNVSEVLKLQGFDFMLTYDRRVLNCLSVEEGTFLSEFGPTIVAKLEIDNSFSGDRGRVWFAACIYGTGFADGSGSLAVITFKAVSIGETVLDLYSDFPFMPDMVKFTTCSSHPIANKAIDGYVSVVASGSSDPPDPPPGDDPDPPKTSLRSDVNGDGVVDIKDLVIIAAAFGTVEGDIKYDARADLDHNDSINICDVALAAHDYMS
jgi:hypothetical protein